MSSTPLPALSEEKKVIQAVQNGDKQAAAQLYGWFGVKIFRQVIIPRLPDVDQAEDILRDTFRIVFEKIEQFKSADRSIFFWMRRIAINLVIDAYRKQVKKRKIAESILARDAISEVMADVEPAPDQGLYDRDARDLIDRSLDKINPRYARALRLRLLQEESRESCAEKMGITVNNFDVLLHRACKAFRDNYPP
ncbi:MAG: RNA polymerase sigma factor [Myxococcota bacterium]|nr:RNA polymerase sigma factor [Myxococcota bacterium]